MAERFGVLVPIAESLVAEIGDAEAWRIARINADEQARHRSPTLVYLRGSSYSQNFPFADPETGKEMEPMRAYRFIYTEPDYA